MSDSDAPKPTAPHATEPDGSPSERAERTAELAAWADKIHEQVARIGALLAKDVVVHLRRAAREAFTRSDRADQFGDAAVADLKAQVDALADQLGPWVSGQIASHDWLAEPALGTEAELGRVPHIEHTQAGVNTELGRILHGAGLGEPAPWTLPQRFIDGDDLISLARGLVKLIAHHRRLDSVVQRSVRHLTTSERARRWDDA
jgi:hypothetical protein